MIKKILVTLIAFVLGLSVTTYVMVKRHKNVLPPVALAPADSSKAAVSDSAAKPETKVVVDSAKPRPDSALAHAATPPLVVPTLPAVNPAPAVDVAVPAISAAVPVNPVDRAQAYKNVARIFASMKPTEAAQVLGLLSDTEVEGILRAVGPKQAADFLTNLPKERAAALSRRLLVPRPPTESAAGK